MTNLFLISLFFSVLPFVSITNLISKLQQSSTMVFWADKKQPIFCNLKTKNENFIQLPRIFVHKTKFHSLSVTLYFSLVCLHTTLVLSSTLTQQSKNCHCSKDLLDRKKSQVAFISTFLPTSMGTTCDLYYPYGTILRNYLCACSHLRPLTRPLTRQGQSTTLNHSGQESISF